jgi:RNA polymerase sigma-70 factor, ECF subfamily
MRDQVLHARACAGDSAAVRAIWDRYAPLVRGLLRRVFGPEDEVEDAVHDVFVRLLESVSQVRDGNALRSYIVTIALNTARAEQRRRKVRRFFGLASRDAASGLANIGLVSAALDEPGTQVAVARLLRLLDALPREERTMLVLRYVEEMELTEVAAMAGVSLATVKRRLSKAAARIVARAKRDAILNEYLDEPAETENALCPAITGSVLR